MTFEKPQETLQGLPIVLYNNQLDGIRGHSNLHKIYLEPELAKWNSVSSTWHQGHRFNSPFSRGERQAGQRNPLASCLAFCFFSFLSVKYFLTTLLSEGCK
jgi:hypothetical protein